MTDIDDLERRLSVVEDRLQMEAGLAAGRDRDVSDMQVTLRSHTAMLQALQERQAAQGEVLQEHGRMLGEHGRMLGEVLTKIDTVFAGQETIITMLTGLIGESPS